MHPFCLGWGWLGTTTEPSGSLVKLVSGSAATHTSTSGNHVRFPGSPCTSRVPADQLAVPASKPHYNSIWAPCSSKGLATSDLQNRLSTVWISVGTEVSTAYSTKIHSQWSFLPIIVSRVLSGLGVLKASVHACKVLKSYFNELHSTKIFTIELLFQCI